MVKKNGVVHGDNCVFDVGKIRMTQKFIGALQALDDKCEPDSVWDVYREGKTWIAESCNGPFDPVVYKANKDRWVVMCD